MRKLTHYLSVALLSFLFSQSLIADNLRELQPEASTIWDAYFPDGGHRANSDRLFPVIPTIGYNSEATSASFYFDSDVALLQPGITALHNRGMKYYMFLEFYVLEIDTDTLLATDPLIPDADFGLTYNLDGSKSASTRSINRPDYFDFTLRCIKRGIDAGADGIQFDMAGQEFLDSFDPDDVAAFVDYLKDNHPSSVWTSEGIVNIDTLDYRKWIYDYKGITNFPLTTDINSSTPLARYWYLFKVQRIQDSWKALSDSTKAYAQNNYGREFTIVGNNYHFGTAGQHGIQTMGNVCGEYFSFTERYPLKGTTTTRHKALQSCGKRNLMWTTPHPGAECLCDNVEFDEHMVAESFASGGLAQFAGEVEERAGYAKYFNLVQTQRDLLNSVLPTGEVGVILAMPTTVCAWGSIDPNYGAQLLMQDLGRSYEVVIAGTDLGWPDSLKLSDLTKYEMVVLHEGIFLTDNQVSVFLDYANQGGNLMVFGTGLSPGWTGAQDENGQDRTNSTWQNLVTGSTRISTHGAGKVAFIQEIADPNDGNCRIYFRYVNETDSAKNAITRSILNTVRTYTDLLIDDENIRVDMSDRVTIFRSESETEDMMLYHLVSHDVDSITRLHNRLTNKTIKLALMDNLAIVDSVFVTIYNPDNPQGTELGNIKVDAARVSVTIPDLFIWEMIKISNKQSGNQVQAKDFTITNAIDDFKLSYNGKPEFSWVDVNNSQEKYQLELWSNATYYGSPIYESGWVTSSDTTFSYTDTNLTEGYSYFTRLRIKSAANDTSEWTNTTFHINKRPDSPTHNYGISAALETTPNVAFWWAEARDMEGEVLQYFWELYTDSLTSNFTDSTNIYLEHTSGYSIHDVNGGGDGVADTLKTALDIDNCGMWWRVYSYDGVDNSEPSRWARFTWDQRDDPPNPFNLIEPANNYAFKTNLNTVRFNWECTGNPDPSSPGQPDFNLYFAEDPNFTVNVVERSGFPQMVFNPPFPISGHKIVYWRVKSNDYTGNSCWSNQTRKLFIDNGSNTAPSQPMLMQPVNGGNADEGTLLIWQTSNDNQSDSIYYSVQIDINPSFSAPIASKSAIFDDVAPVAISINQLDNYANLSLGNTYYWRVKAKDRYINGTSSWSETRSFTYGTGVGIQDPNLNKEIYVYPNPVKSSSLLHIPNDMVNKVSIKIWNAQGKILYKGMPKESTIRINKNDYLAGVYFYEVSESSGMRTEGKFIVE